MKTARHALIFLMITTSLSLASVAHAQQNGSVQCTTDTNGAKFCFLTDTSGSSKFNTLYTSGNLTQFISRLFAISLSVGAMLAVLRLSWAGYLYMTSEAFGQKTHAKEVIGDAVLGLVLLLSVYLILYQINPKILDLQVLNDLKQVQTAPQTGNTAP